MSSLSTRELEKIFRSKWPEALSIWSKYTQLCDPRYCHNDEQSNKEQLTGSFAMIRFADQAIVINLKDILKHKLEEYALEILAHEIGHHVYCPANLADQGRLMARMRRALPTKEDEAPFIGNLYTDLLINDRLQRTGNLRIGDVYKKLVSSRAGEPKMWTFYMRIYEILWALPNATLTSGKISSAMEGDAYLGARLVRSFSKEWLDGAGRFAALCLPYLLENEHHEMKSLIKGLLDSMSCSNGSAVPQGLVDEDPAEREGAKHPADDPDLSGFDKTLKPQLDANSQAPEDKSAVKRSTGQCREPFEYGAILRNLGLNLDDHEIAVAYYKERAAPHLVRFPEHILPESTDPLPEGLEAWDIGSPIENIDWMGSVLTSPHIIPSFTTQQRIWGSCQGSTPEKRPVDLDIYVDCSGSMPQPHQHTSYLALAGVIIALSAMRTGACVQATLWSGPNQFESTDGFITDEKKILRVITGYIGGSTAFPLHIFRKTYENRKASQRAVHIVVISDEGADTMFSQDEHGRPGSSIVETAIKNCRGGGSLLLNLGSYDWRKSKIFVEVNKLGFDIYPLSSWEELLDFAREFSARAYSR